MPSDGLKVETEPGQAVLVVLSSPAHMHVKRSLSERMGENLVAAAQRYEEGSLNSGAVVRGCPAPGME